MKTYSAAKARALFDELKKNHTWTCPTLMTARLFLWKNDQPFFGDPRIKYVPRWMRERLTTFDLHQGIPESEVSFRRQWYGHIARLVAEMNKAGVPMLAGTDTLLLNIPGFGLHEELALLVDAGLTPLEALRTATINPAKFLGKEKEFGTIEKGKLADLVLLDANPLKDIHNTRKINAVVVNGRLLGRETLDRMLGDVEAAANKK
jgi:predicted amidohydrolase